MRRYAVPIALASVSMQHAPRLEPRRRAGKRESQEQSQQGEHRALGGAGALGQALRIAREPRDTDAPADFEGEQHADEQRDGQQHGDPGEVHLSSRVQSVREARVSIRLRRDISDRQSTSTRWYP